jgi:hypothetical protein
MCVQRLRWPPSSPRAGAPPPPVGRVAMLPCQLFVLGGPSLDHGLVWTMSRSGLGKLQRLHRLRSRKLVYMHPPVEPSPHCQKSTCLAGSRSGRWKSVLPFVAPRTASGPTSSRRRTPARSSSRSRSRAPSTSSTRSCWNLPGKNSPSVRRPVLPIVAPVPVVAVFAPGVAVDDVPSRAPPVPSRPRPPRSLRSVVLPSSAPFSWLPAVVMRP